MITFAYPWVFIILVLPVLIVKFFPAHRESQSSLRVPFLTRLSRLISQEPSSGAVVLRRSAFQMLLLSLLWLSAITALARPQFVGEPITKTKPSRDLLLAVDLSGSMDAEDFTDAAGNQVDRLTAVKQVLDEFLTRREGDRVGLVFFGSAAFVQAPFTEDLQLCQTLLDEAQVRMAGPQTVIGDAVGLSLTVFERSDQEERVLILLTDGNDTNSQVPPERAAEIAKNKGVTIHTVVVGDPEAVGEEEIDEEVLKSMAATTGGDFFRANDRDELDAIYTRLDELEPQKLESISYRPKSELFQWPLAAFLIAGLLYHGVYAVRHLSVFHQAPAIALSLSIAAVLLTGASDPTGMMSLNTGFHFLRPLWLLTLVPCFLIVWDIWRRQDSQKVWRGIIDENLLPHLIVTPQSQSRLRPVHLLAIAWLCSSVALAGPTWNRQPTPFTEDEAAVVFAVEVTPTMLAQDIQPSRLERAVHKISDLLALRSGADAALIAYSGSAHIVMPLTTDAEIIEMFAAELNPEIMPQEGDNVREAITLGNSVLSSSDRTGSIVLLTDGITESQEMSESVNNKASIHILAIAGEQKKPLPLNSPPAPVISVEGLKNAAAEFNSTLTVVTADDTDIQKLSRNITTSFIAAQQEDARQQWKDSGYWLTPFIALMTLIWFRPGWVVKWS